MQAKLHWQKIYFLIQIVSEQKEDVRTYEEGFTKDDGIIIDASRYGVSNVYEAVQLYKNFIHF